MATYISKSNLYMNVQLRLGKAIVTYKIFHIRSFYWTWPIRQKAHLHFLYICGSMSLMVHFKTLAKPPLSTLALYIYFFDCWLDRRSASACQIFFSTGSLCLIMGCSLRRWHPRGGDVVEILLQHFLRSTCYVINFFNF